MLTELNITNFAIIDKIRISFKDGLNVISGETGAGKSIILKSLSLLMGQKATSGIIKSGATQATIEGAFDLSSRSDIKNKLDEMGIDTSEDQLVVRRILSAQGKSRVYINGSLCALANLKEIVSPLIEVTGQNTPLIEMTGQHDSRQLQERSYHLDILDSYTSAWTLRSKVTDSYNKLQSLKETYNQLINDQKTKAQRLDFLSFQAAEINNLDLKAGEEEELENSTKRFKNASKLTDFTKRVESHLYSDEGSCLVRLHDLIQASNEIKDVDSELHAKSESLLQAKTLIEEVVYDIRSYEKNIDADPETLYKAQEKLSSLRKLQKKYGASVEEILEELTAIESEIAILENSDEELIKLETTIKDTEAELLKLSKDLHKRRLNGSELFETSVSSELLDLNMKGVQFVVRLKKTKDIKSHGMTEVEFMTKASQKDEARSLHKFASGGELSRILLSVKRVLGKSEKPRTYLFDEVDAGVSGVTAEKVGQKLRSIAKGQQIICVTHLPQVACFADSHYFIQKTPDKDGVVMAVSELKADDQVNEIARLISGEKITQTSLDHAKQLLKN